MILRQMLEMSICSGAEIVSGGGCSLDRTIGWSTSNACYIPRPDNIVPEMALQYVRDEALGEDGIGLYLTQSGPACILIFASAPLQWSKVSDEIIRKADACDTAIIRMPANVTAESFSTALLLAISWESNYRDGLEKALRGICLGDNCLSENISLGVYGLSEINRYICVIIKLNALRSSEPIDLSRHLPLIESFFRVEIFEASVVCVTRG